MFVLTVKKPGGRTEHFAVETRLQADTMAKRLGALLPLGGQVSILKRLAKGGMALVGGLMKTNPRRVRNPAITVGQAGGIGKTIEHIHDILHGRVSNPRRRRRR
jgi:hypothetical protein